MPDFDIEIGDCLSLLASYPDGVFDAVLTDPPYGITFSGNEWDASIPGKEYWEEILRVSKPGAFMLAFGLPRTFHRLVTEIENGGWEIRDTIVWVFGSGFPKSLNAFKALQKTASGREIADLFKGYGTALKPAMEPICLCRKPFKGTLANNLCKHGTGALNIEGTRVPGDDHAKAWDKPVTTNISKGDYVNSTEFHKVDLSAYKPTGRWPANFILGEDANLLGEESRYFYCPKASKKERGENNKHTTVKPLDLMQYLCRMVCPPDAVVLDPFCGSGSTGVAAVREGFSFIGIEKEQEYAEIARERIGKEA